MRAWMRPTLYRDYYGRPSPIPQGQTAVFLPREPISLLRVNKLPPQFARFQVPLRFSKLDLRDLLWNGFGVWALRINVLLRPNPARPRLYAAAVPARDLSWYRPQPRKIMTVEMDKPFVWPQSEEVIDSSERETYLSHLNTRERVFLQQVQERQVPADAIMYRDAAQKLLEGRRKWKA